MTIKYLIVLVLTGFATVSFGHKPPAVYLHGYVITLDGNLWFSALDSPCSITNAFKENAFLLGTVQTRSDDLEGALLFLGDSLTIQLNKNEFDSLDYLDKSIHFFYCEIGLLFSLTNSDDIKFFKNPFYLLKYKYNIYEFNSISLKNKVVYIKAYDDKINNKMKAYYHNRNYTLPRFLIYSE